MKDQKKNGGGFVQIPWYVVQKTTDAELKTLAVLTHYCSMQGGGFPSIETIAREAGKHRRAVSTSLDRLTKKGFIVKSSRKGQTSVYSFPGKAAKPQEPPADPPEEVAGTYAENCTGIDTGNLCGNLHTTYAENCTQNKNDLIILKQDHIQGHGHSRTRTREKKKKTEGAKANLESLITFQVANPDYDSKDKERMEKKNIFPFISEGIDAIYQAGLKIGYRMTVAEVFKFAFVMIDGGITNRKGIFHPIRDFDSLLFAWRDKQTPEAQRQAVSEQERLKAGQPVSGGRWQRLAPFPELAEIDPIREHTLYKTMQRAGCNRYWKPEVYSDAEKAFDALPDSEKARALKIIEERTKKRPYTDPREFFNLRKAAYWRKYDFI